MGHALFLSIQDTLTRFYKACGHTTLWAPGIDHAGLATHSKILAYQKETLCSYEQASEHISSTHKDIILKQIQAMGAMPDWDYLTYTMDKPYQNFALKILKLLNEDGLIYHKDGQFYLDMSSWAKILKKDIQEGMIKIIPQTEIGTLIHFLDNIEPWCISRQMPWGINLPLTDDLIYDETHFSDHTLDTWFNSSLWPLACLLKEPHLIEKFYPATLIETGADILFFWCAKMLMMGNYLYRNQARLELDIPSAYPFYTIYLHGLIRDKHNRKFSKSLGNGIDPLDMIEKYGADALRLFLISRTGPAEDMKFNEQELHGFKKFMNKIWQAGKFFSIYAAQNHMERQTWNLECEALKNIEHQYITYLDNYDFLNASRFIQHTFKSWLCDTWIEENKPLIQAGDKATIQMGLFLYEQFLTMLEPFCPFICSELKFALYQ